jgi:hypothetical protein
MLTSWCLRRKYSIDRGSGARVLALVGVLSASAALAFPLTLTPSGQPDFTYGAQVDVAGGPATSSKPESKLFYTPDGRWWAVLGTAGGPFGAGAVLSQLDANHTWLPKLRLPGSDPWAKADALLEGATLYVSLRDNRASTTSGGKVKPAKGNKGHHNPPTGDNVRVSQLYVLSYGATGAWTVVSGPTRITTGDPEALTLARDSAGRLWTAYESSLAIRVGSTAPGGTAFTFADITTASVTADDLATVTAFGTDATGRKIGVLWSDQVAKQVHFAWRHDGDPIGDAAWHIETAFGGGVGGCPTANADACGDDHLNVKVSGDDLYVATKTSLDSVSSPAPGDPLIVLLHRDAAGAWDAVTVSPVSQHATRPIVLLAPELDRLWVFATRSPGVVVWESALSALGFTPTSFVVWTKSATAGPISDATSTKQSITAASGAVVETSSELLHQYWHNKFLP